MNAVTISSIVWLVLVLVCVSPGGVRSLYVRFKDGNHPMAAREGKESVSIFCQQNLAEGSEYDTVFFEHQNPVTLAKRFLGIVRDDTASDVASGYRINPIAGDNTLKTKTIILTIDTIGMRDDGMFLCTAVSTSGNANADSENVAAKNVSATKDMIVLQDLKVLRLQIGDWSAVSTKPVDAVEVSVGAHRVKCMAEGSNPATESVVLIVDGVRFDLQQKLETTLMAGDFRRFRTTGVWEVDLNQKHSDHRLQCLARDSTGTQLKTEMDVLTVVPQVEGVTCNTEPKVKGESRSASVVSLVCLVNHTRIGHQEFDFAYQVGKTGQLLRPGVGHSPDDEDDEFEVTTQPLSEGVTRVTLSVAKPLDWHFLEDFYLVVNTSDGHVTKEVTRLRKPEPEPKKPEPEPTPKPEPNKVPGEDTDDKGNNSVSIGFYSIVLARWTYIGVAWMTFSVVVLNAS